MSAKTFQIAGLLVAVGLSSGAFAPVVSPTEASPYRSLPSLESFFVRTCLGDSSLFWITRSRAEERALFTPGFYERCSSGTSKTRIWPVSGRAEGSARYDIIESRQTLETRLREMAANSAMWRLPDSPRWMADYLDEVRRALPDFDKESLVLLSDVYGGTGMAKGVLDLSVVGDVLTARVVVELPPPPLSPDTATFFFALAVEKARIRHVKVIPISPN